MILVGGKNKKKSWKVTFSIGNRQITYVFMQFLGKNPLFFVHVGGEKKKKFQIFFFSSGMISPRRRTSSSQTI